MHKLNLRTVGPEGRLQQYSPLTTNNIWKPGFGCGSGSMKKPAAVVGKKGTKKNVDKKPASNSFQPEKEEPMSLDEKIDKFAKAIRETRGSARLMVAVRTGAKIVTAGKPAEISAWKKANNQMKSRHPASK